MLKYIVNVMSNMLIVMVASVLIPFLALSLSLSYRIAGHCQEGERQFPGHGWVSRPYKGFAEAVAQTLVNTAGSAFQMAVGLFVLVY